MYNYIKYLTKTSIFAEMSGTTGKNLKYIFNYFVKTKKKYTIQNEYRLKQGNNLKKDNIILDIKLFIFMLNIIIGDQVMECKSENMYYAITL